MATATHLRHRSLDEAIERAAAENKPLLSPVTQQQYLAALRDVLVLAVKKRLIPVNAGPLNANSGHPIAPRARQAATRPSRYWQYRAS